MVDVECEHPHITAAGEPLADQARVADRDDRPLVGERRRQLRPGAVGTDLLGEFPDRIEGFGRRRDVRAQPPQRTGERVPLDDPPAGDDQSRRIEVQ